ncbi:hypothetical protein DENSPDRAFT_854957 [Dentipellis sp. KUC8613]|nr:hypothetical protein DENSPDRAFT_854957 [Dentipellis sp. KUC8613]
MPAGIRSCRGIPAANGFSASASVIIGLGLLAGQRPYIPYCLHALDHNLMYLTELWLQGAPAFEDYKKQFNVVKPDFTFAATECRGSREGLRGEWRIRFINIYIESSQL